MTNQRGSQANGVWDLAWEHARGGGVVDEPYRGIARFALACLVFLASFSAINALYCPAALAWVMQEEPEPIGAGIHTLLPACCLVLGAIASSIGSYVLFRFTGRLRGTAKQVQWGLIATCCGGVLAATPKLAGMLIGSDEWSRWGSLLGAPDAAPWIAASASGIVLAVLRRQVTDLAAVAQFARSR